MEFQDVIRRRKMCRSFADRPVPADLLERILDNGRHAPSAGFAQGWDFVVLQGKGQTDLFWAVASDPAWRANPDWPGLLRAPVIILPLAHEQAYLDRYAEPDKPPSPGQPWMVPYWFVDTSFAVMNMLLTVVDVGMGALFFRLRRDEGKLLETFGIPAGYQPIGAMALGWPDRADRPSRSVARGHREDVIHRGRW